ncbi:MAG: cyclic nucleotide-binding domain-containing protein [Chloroflexi bacterium]|nr:cyclic nucleotide-binding domain-containing protein [Chloroflexota bacterium]
MEREEMLKKVPIFAGLDRRHLKQLSKLMVPRTFNAGAVIFKENDQAAGFFVISSGKVEVVRDADSDRPHALATLGPGDFFGEMALFEGQARSATVRALKDTELLAMTRWDFSAELNSNAEIAVGVLETVVRRLRELETRLSE